MDDLIRRYVATLRGMWKYRWYGVATAWIVGVVGAVAVMFIPDKYEASARVFVNTDSILKPLMAGLTVQAADNPRIDDSQRIEMLSRLVITRPNVAKIAHEVGLDATAKSKAEVDRVVDNMMKVLQINGAVRDNIYTLSYRDPQPQRAKKVVELLTSTFMQSGKEDNSGDTEAAKKFIDEQIATYEKKLEEAENRLKDFRLRNIGVAPGEGKDYYSRMSEVAGLLNQAQLELREAENSRDAYKRELASLEPSLVQGSTPGNGGGSLADIDARLDAMRRSLDNLLQKYTDDHPDVVGTRRGIKELEEQRRQLVLARKKEGLPLLQSSADGPRAYEQLKVSMAEAEAKVASLRIRVGEYSSRYSQQKESAKMMPQLEAEYAQLNRDYDINKKNYESLVARRESASLSGDMQSVSGVADFRLIDPPRVSPRPVSPNRLILLPGMLLAALVAGLAVTYIVREARPTFYDGRALREVTGLPLLGVVSLIVSEPMKHDRRKSLVRFLASVGALGAAYMVGFVALVLLTVRVA